MSSGIFFFRAGSVYLFTCDVPAPAAVPGFSGPQVSLLLERQLACPLNPADSRIILPLIMPPSPSVMTVY